MVGGCELDLSGSGWGWWPALVKVHNELSCLIKGREFLG
jgi:hypothetical protein